MRRRSLWCGLPDAVWAASSAGSLFVGGITHLFSCIPGRGHLPQVLLLSFKVATTTPAVVAGEQEGQILRVTITLGTAASLMADLIVELFIG